MTGYCDICKGQGSVDYCKKCGKQVCANCSSSFLGNSAQENVRCINCGGFTSDCVDIDDELF